MQLICTGLRSFSCSLFFCRHIERTSITHQRAWPVQGGCAPGEECSIWRTNSLFPAYSVQKSTLLFLCRRHAWCRVKQRACIGMGAAHCEPASNHAPLLAHRHVLMAQGSSAPVEDWALHLADQQQLAFLHERRAERAALAQRQLGPPSGLCRGGRLCSARQRQRRPGRSQRDHQQQWQRARAAVPAARPAGGFRAAARLRHAARCGAMLLATFPVLLKPFCI